MIYKTPFKDWKINFEYFLFKTNKQKTQNSHMSFKFFT